LCYVQLLFDSGGLNMSDRIAEPKTFASPRLVARSRGAQVRASRTRPSAARWVTPSLRNTFLR